MENTTKNKTFSIEDIIAKSWGLTWDNIGILSLITFIGGLILVIVHVFSWAVLHPINFIGPLLGGLLNLIVGCIIGIGFINIALKVIDNQKVRVNDLFSKMEIFANYFLSVIVQNIIVAIGFFFLIIPGIFFIVRFSVSLYALVDHEMGAFEAIQRSWEMVKGCSWKVFGLVVVCILIDILGLIAFVIGLLVTIPLTLIAFALLYRELERQTYNEVVHTPEVEIIS